MYHTDTQRNAGTDIVLRPTFDCGKIKGGLWLVSIVFL
jgi:hypothetical protein